MNFHFSHMFIKFLFGCTIQICMKPYHESTNSTRTWTASSTSAFSTNHRHHHRNFNMAVKECGSHGSSNSPRLLNFLRRYIIWLIILIVVTIIGSVLAWITLHTPKPRFILQDATVFSFNVSGDPPNLLTSSIQTTLISRNDKTGIYYDRLDVYASYQDQQITLPTSIPAVYQGHEEVNVWSPFIGGRSVPIARTNGLSLVQEQSRGAVKVLVHIDGKIRWKVGPLITRTSHLFVKCPALISFGNSAAGAIVSGRGVKYTLVTVCSVSVWKAMTDLVFNNNDFVAVVYHEFTFVC